MFHKLGNQRRSSKQAEKLRQKPTCILLSLFVQERKEKEEIASLFTVQMFSWTLLPLCAIFTRGGEISIKLFDLGQENGFGLTIRDSGVGMDAAQVENLFRPFEQGDMSLSRNHEGAGLGLAVVMKYCKQLNARIDIKSKVNVGTRITIEFPEPDFEEETGELNQAA